MITSDQLGIALFTLFIGTAVMFVGAVIWNWYDRDGSSFTGSGKQ